MFKYINNYWKRKKEREEAKQASLKRHLNFSKSLDELIRVTARNRQHYQIEKYGICFSEGDICHMQNEARSSIWSYLNDYYVIIAIQDIILKYETRLEAKTPAAILEYGR